MGEYHKNKKNDDETCHLPNMNTATEDIVKQQQRESRGEVEEIPGEPPTRILQKAQSSSSLDCLMN